MSLSQDIILDDSAFNTASQELATLKTDTENLKIKLEAMYTELFEALDTPAGEQFKQTAIDIVITPIEDMILVIDHISLTLTDIISGSYYKNVFTEFDELNQSIKF